MTCSSSTAIASSIGRPQPRSIADFTNPIVAVGPVGKAAGLAGHDLVEVVARDEVDESFGKRLVGGESRRVDDEPLRAVRTDQPGQALGAAGAGEDAEVGLGKAEGRLGVQDSQVAGQASSAPPPSACPLSAATTGLGASSSRRCTSTHRRIAR